MLMLIKRLLHAIFMPVFLTLSLSLLAQDRVVTGKVTDSKDASAVVGASVLVKGTTVGTSTNAEGNFSFSVPSSAKTLVVSSVGFTTIEIDITGMSTVPVSLTATAGSLSEIVVTGYGTQRRKEVTVAIATVNAEQFNKGNISDVAQLLQGKAAGLSIARAGGDPNAGYVIRLRGLSTLGANTQPLVVVDGQVGADLNTVDPNDIASVDILKDGSAAAIYGTRGSAGVIIITTKKGRAGTSLVSYNGAVTAESPVKFTEHMTAAEFRALGNGIDYGASTDWNEEITRTAYSQVHNLSISGGSQQTTYSASVNYRGSQGVAIRTGFKQINGRLNLSHKTINNKLALNLILNTTRRTSDRGFADAFKYATIYNPTAPIHSSDPLYDLAGGGYFEANLVDYSNPVAVLEQNTNEGELQRLNITASADYEILKGLKFLIRYAQQTSSFYNEQYSPITAFISRGFPVGAQFGNYQGSARHGYSYKRDDENFNQLYENTLSYERGFNHINMTALAGYSYQNFINKGYSLGAGNFVTDESGQNFGAALDVQQGLANVASYKNGYELVALFGRINLNWESTVFLSASLRREGSTMFGSNNTWGNFPAVSAGVDIKKLVNIPIFDALKLRGSFGVTGALPPGPYLSLDRLQTQGTYYAGNGIYNFVYSGVGTNPNPDLKWEKKEELDIGLDFTLLNSRLTGSFDYYNRSTKDLIFNVTVPSPPNLYTTTWKNIGQLDNNGFELTVNYDVFKGEGLNWTTAANFSRYDIVLTKLDESLKGSYVGATNLGTPGQEADAINKGG